MLSRYALRDVFRDAAVIAGAATLLSAAATAMLPYAAADTPLMPPPPPFSATPLTPAPRAATITLLAMLHADACRF